MLSVLPSIDASVATLAPGFRALSITAEATRIIHPDIADAALADACKSVIAGEASWADAHLAAWANVFRKFGAKPQRTPCSAEALRKRVLRDGGMPGIDPVVDLYNAVSLQYAIPVGGENLAAYVGAPRLTMADGTEQFDVMKDGLLAQERPEPGEVIWRDDEGVTCRRWNWRQGVRTRLNAETRHMWFILESLPAMPLKALYDAGERLTDGLQRMMPGVCIETALIGSDRRE
ncbi:B3/B4 domain-containing protein [Dickeya dadantii]|uniref:B3/B4 domain-containing protein n=1 Tax=Dickeya dadantii TaxID=204038 RepID=UPI001C0DEF84|nr:B3/4 domain-containing protein [Dickeya dadantii]QWT41154.1 B3/4 domain-containing protein [Dickeya dadantii]